VYKYILMTIIIITT